MPRSSSTSGRRGLDGFEVCRRIRAEEVWAPVLMLTARDEVGDRVKGLDVGADDYLVKPFSLLELAARLRALLVATTAVARPCWRWTTSGSIRASKRAWRGDVELGLSPKEFALLEVFLALTPALRADPNPDHRGRPGTLPTTAPRTSWTSTSTTCAARSTHRTGAMTWRLSVAGGNWAAGRRARVAMSDPTRLALVFAFASAVVFTLGSWLFVTELARSLQGTVDSPARSPAGSGIPRPPRVRDRGTVTRNPRSGGVRRPGRRPGRPSPRSQRGRRVLPSGVPDLSQARTGRVPATVTGDGERQRVLAAPRPGTPAGSRSPASPGDPRRHGQPRDRRGSPVTGSVLVLAAGLGAYVLARSALSPVERLRREVAELSEREDAPGVRVPATRDEIAALATTMNQLLTRLRGALTRQRALVADASHELRTPSPFAVLSGELELAGRPGRSREELAGAITRAGDETAPARAAHRAAASSGQERRGPWSCAPGWTDSARPPHPECEPRRRTSQGPRRPV